MNLSLDIDRSKPLIALLDRGMTRKGRLRKLSLGVFEWQDGVWHLVKESWLETVSVYQALQVADCIGFPKPFARQKRGES